MQDPDAKSRRGNARSRLSLFVISGRASWREPGIQNHYREDGFSDPQLRIIARRFAAFRNDDRRY